MIIQSRITISVIIPCRNEVHFIDKCLNSVISQDYPKGNMEVLVVDGMSEDGSKDIIESYTEKYPFVKLLDNPNNIIPSAMNIGIKKSSGDIIMKIDAHTVYESDYISKCIDFLNRYDADNVGGLSIPVPREDTLVGKGIVASLSHPFGVGNSPHRLSPKGPMWADTAYSGCYKRDVFERIGLYDENIARSEDVAINSKLRRAGGKILLVPEIKTYYYARSSLLDFIRHNFDNGFWITYPLKYGRVVFSWRHLIPLAFVSSLIGTVILSFFLPIFVLLFMIASGSYLLLNLYCSGRIAIQKKDLRIFSIMPVVFTLLHVGNGLGCLWGFICVVCSGWLSKKSQSKDRRSRYILGSIKK